MLNLNRKPIWQVEVPKLFKRENSKEKVFLKMKVEQVESEDHSLPISSV